MTHSRCQRRVFGWSRDSFPNLATREFLQCGLRECLRSATSVCRTIMHLRVVGSRTTLCAQGRRVYSVVRNRTLARLTCHYENRPLTEAHIAKTLSAT